MYKKATEWINFLREGKGDERLLSLYVDKHMVTAQKERYINAIEEFVSLFGDLEVAIFSAPGRSEICGNHTDHQYGKVLGASVNMDIISVCAKTDDMKVSIKSEGYMEMIEAELSDLKPNVSEYGTTSSLVCGVAAGFEKRGAGYGGFKAYVTSTVLSGSGLSSSAAFEILMGTIFNHIYNDEKFDAVTLAVIGKEAENIYFGKPSGLLDQMSCSIGGLVKIDFIDPTNPIVEPVKVEFESFGQSLCVIDTKGSHADLTDDYASIPKDMKKVAKYFGKEVLRQVDEKEFYEELSQVRKFAGDRAVMRAIHFFDENERVDEEVNALKTGDFPTFKQLVRECGNSSYRYLQNVYSPQKPTEQSICIALVMTKKILGKDVATRVQGGGFAGTIQTFVPNDKVSYYREEIEKLFGKGSCYVLKIRPEGGVRVF